MYVITGITGQVGSQVAERLLAKNLPVRALVRDLAKAKQWHTRGVELVQGDFSDTHSLAAAFAGAEGVFILTPPQFDPQPGFPEAQAIAHSIKQALEKAKPKKVVYLSTIGADANEENLLSQHSLSENILSSLSLPITFLRPSWFFENFVWDIESAKQGTFSSYLQPLDRGFPMIATQDIGHVAAELLTETWGGHRVVELAHRALVTPLEIAQTFELLLGIKVEAKVIPRSEWEGIFRAQGTKNPMPRVRMIDGFNEGWIRFSPEKNEHRKGSTSFTAVLTSLLKRSS